MQQVIINNCREVGILEVVAVDGKPFLNLLLDEIIDDGIGIYRCPAFPNTETARKGFTTFIHPLFHFLR